MDDKTLLYILIALVGALFFLGIIIASINKHQNQDDFEIDIQLNQKEEVKVMEHYDNRNFEEQSPLEKDTFDYGRQANLSINDLIVLSDYYNEGKRAKNINNLLPLIHNYVQRAKASPSKEWLGRYLSYALDMYSQDVYEFWAKIYAYEVLNPRSVPLHRLDELRNVTIEEIKLLNRIGPFVFNEEYLFRNTLVNNFYYQESDIEELFAYGLVDSEKGDGLAFSVASHSLLQFYDHRLVANVRAKNGDLCSLQISTYKLTKRALELLTIMNHPQNGDYFIRNFASIRDEKRNQNVKITIHKILQKSGDQIEFEEDSLLED